VTAHLVGERDDGMSCNAVYVPLAAAYDLPPSPVPVSRSKENISDIPPPGDLATALSGSSRLSVNERVSNMHYGYAAFHAPPAVPLVKKGNTKQRSTGSQNNTTSSRPPAQGGRPTFKRDKKGSDPNLEKLDKKGFHRSGSLPQIAK
jgi:hypothetical protein